MCSSQQLWAPSFPFRTFDDLAEDAQEEGQDRIVFSPPFSCASKKNSQRIARLGPTEEG